MKCAYCGAEMEKDSVFCPSCGKEVQLVSASSVLEDDYLNEFLDDDSSKKSKKGSGRSRSSSSSQGDSDKKQQKKLIIVSVCVMLFVVGVVAALVNFLIYNDHNNSLSYQLEQAKKAVEADDRDKAVSHYERALKLDRNNVEVRIALGDIYLAQKEYDSAQIMYQEAVSIDAKNVDAYRGLLKVYDEQGLYDRITELGESIEDETILAELSDYLVEAPVFNLQGGEYTDAVEIILTAQDDAKIYYTTDGKDPIVYGSVYKEPFDFDNDGEYKISAVAVNGEGVYSMTVEQEYVVNIAAPEMPKVSPDGGNFGALTYISINVPDNCTAYYTWDGSDPNINSRKYASPIPVPEGSNVFSVMYVDNRTGKNSEIYRSNYSYYEQ